MKNRPLFVLVYGYPGKVQMYQKAALEEMQRLNAFAIYSADANSAIVNDAWDPNGQELDIKEGDKEMDEEKGFWYHVREAAIGFFTGILVFMLLVLLSILVGVR